MTLQQTEEALQTCVIKRACDRAVERCEITWRARDLIFEALDHTDCDEEEHGTVPSPLSDKTYRSDSDFHKPYRA